MPVSTLGHSRHFPWLSLLAVLALATALRLNSIGFGLPALYDPDEPLFVIMALKLLKQHTLNPGWFGHPGTTTIYALALIYVVVIAGALLSGRFADVQALIHSAYQDPGMFVLPGRLFMLACGLAVIVLSFVLARRLFGTSTALVAAVLLAVDPVHIQYSQVIRTDMHATVFVLGAMILALRIVERGRLIDYGWTALLLGFACATKWPAAAAAAAMIGATAARIAANPHERAKQLGYLVAGMFGTIAALLVASPYLLLDHATVVADLAGEARQHHPGSTGFGLLGNALWYLQHPLLRAMGPLGIVLAAAGLVIATRSDRRFLAVVLPVTLSFYFAICAQALIWERWIVPLLPIVAITAAVAITSGARLASRWGQMWGHAFAAVILLIIAVPNIAAGRGAARERTNDTRAVASAWARTHIPAGSTVLLEHLAFDLSGQPWRFLFPLGRAGCIDARAALNGQIDFAPVSRSVGHVPIIDVGGVPEAMLDRCRPDFAILTNYDRYLAEGALYPEQLRRYDRLLKRGRIVATFDPIAGLRGGRTVRIADLRN